MDFINVSKLRIEPLK